MSLNVIIEYIKVFTWLIYESKYIHEKQLDIALKI